ncbi:MAG TPA: hypothetical protein VEL51_07805 [Vicinamibacterales bacterium]|nr:hypothetical protein [Vicinamibacterales bacterium]
MAWNRTESQRVAVTFPRGVRAVSEYALDGEHAAVEMTPPPEIELTGGVPRIFRFRSK